MTSESGPPRSGSSLLINLENKLLPDAPLPGAEAGSVRPHAIMISPARKFSCLSMPSAEIWEQSNPGGSPLRSMEPRAGLYFCCAFPIPAGDATLPRPKGVAARSARDRPVVMINRPIKTRRLKKAELADDFFFMVLSEV